MEVTIEGLYQSIGHEAVRAVRDLAGRLLVYAEVESGVVSVDIFYIKKGSDEVCFCFAPLSLVETVKLFWSKWKSQAENREWKVMCYLVDENKFTIDLTYPEQLMSQESLSDRRPRAVKRYFGDKKVNYSMR